MSVRIALVCFIAALTSTTAFSLARRHYEDDYGPRCGVEGINDSPYRNSWHPEALVGQREGGRILLMRVSQGPRKFIATVDGCTSQIYHMQGAS